MSSTVLSAVSIDRSYRDGRHQVDVLCGLDFELVKSERVAIVGASGAGKSTLLNILGGLDLPTRGQVIVSGRAWDSLTEAERSQWRNQNLGFVFQFHHLLPEFTALESVSMPARIRGLSRREAEQRARSLLVRVGLEARLTHRPSALSGGERQRVAIARALVNQPAVMLMDEPTGNLDPETAEQVLALMDSLSDVEASFVVVTHDPQIASRMDRQLRLCDGRLQAI